MINCQASAVRGKPTVTASIGFGGCNETEDKTSEDGDTETGVTVLLYSNMGILILSGPPPTSDQKVRRNLAKRPNIAQAHMPTRLIREYSRQQPKRGSDVSSWQFQPGYIVGCSVGGDLSVSQVLSVNTVTDYHKAKRTRLVA